MPELAGNIYENKEGSREILRQLVRQRSFKFGKFILSTGKESNYYFDGKQVTLHPQGAYLVAKAVLEKIGYDNIQAIGGPALGADPIVGALAPVLYLEGLDIKLFIVRKATKEHGARKVIEGPELLPGERVVIVDDVITSGGSIIKAIDTVMETGCHVVKVVVLVDRLEGGTEKIESMGINVDPIFTVKDFIR
ncbi:MAG TPA: orotate phosphoribosyltransferase [Desulfotomaculum sp.]|nr:orotate phosphoribosyltransferase [Desulfotomaculum sp.]